MKLNHAAIALLVERFDAASGKSVPVVYLREGYLPCDVGGDVLFDAEHLDAQRRRLGLSEPSASTEEGTTIEEWAACAERLPDEDDWAALAGEKESAGLNSADPAEEWCSTAVAARVAGISRAALDRIAAATPPDASGVAINKRSPSAKSDRWWWRKARVLDYVLAYRVPMDEAAQRRPPAKAERRGPRQRPSREPAAPAHIKGLLTLAEVDRGR